MFKSLVELESSTPQTGFVASGQPVCGLRYGSSPTSRPGKRISRYWVECWEGLKSISPLSDVAEKNGEREMQESIGSRL